jgi:glycosyltransferase involved in cell wall biosynthesis
MTVSVIVPVYNALPYLYRAVQSIRTQSYKDLEIILVNDGSTDNSPIAIDEIAKQDTRIFTVQQINKGASAARNAGLDCARGEYIMFCDADDLMTPNAIRSMVENSEGADLVVGSFQKTGAMTTEVIAGDSLYTQLGIARYVVDNLNNPRKNQALSGCWAKLYRTETLRRYNVKFPENQKTAEDMSFIFQYLQGCNIIRFMSEKVYTNRKHGAYDSLSTKFDPKDEKSLFGFRQGLQFVRSFLAGKVNVRELDRAAGHSYIYHTILYFIRICGQRFDLSVWKLMDSIISDLDTRYFLARYHPAKGNYRLIPWLLKRGCTPLAMLACRWEARKIYS